MTKKKLFFMAAILVVALVAAIVCLTQLDWSRLPGSLGSNTVRDYNTAATQRAHTAGTIGKNEILLVREITKEASGDVQVAFDLYSVAEEKDLQTLLKLQSQEAAQQAGITLVGTATAKFVADDLGAIRDLKILHNM